MQESKKNRMDEKEDSVKKREMYDGIMQTLQEELPPVRYAEIQTEEYRIELPDGVKLHARAYMPKEAGRYPVILIRNPYVSNEFVIEPFTGPIFAKYGYVLLDVNVRGTIESEGEWLPFENERKDGRYVIDWIAEQEWCDGNIGTFGASYLGHTQWCIADYQHPMLKTMFISVYGIHPYHTFYRRGMARQEIWTAWAAQMMENNRYKFLTPQENYALCKKAYAVKPQKELGEQLTGKKCEWYQKWIGAVDEKDPYWSEGFWKELQEVVKRVKIPLFLHGGWFDIFFRSQIESYRMLPKEVREKSRFLIGPWNHAGMTGGTLSYPDENRAGLFQLKAALEWFDHQLKGMPYAHNLGVIEAYRIGDNKWKEWKDDFKVDAEQVWYFEKYQIKEKQTDSRMRKYEGEKMVPDLPMEEQEISYDYNPADPVESIGGNLLSNNRDPLGQPECSIEQPPTGWRKDVVSFISESFDQSVYMTGAIRIHLFVSSSVPATAFTVKVMEVMKDGRNMNIRDDITDIRWIDEERTEEYETGTVRELILVLTDVSWRIAADSRLRVDISSSNFPAYHVHPNVTEEWASSSKAEIAAQTIYCGGRYPSRIILPIQYEEDEV